MHSFPTSTSISAARFRKFASLCISVLFLAAGPLSSAAVSVDHLRCEYLQNPMGIDRTTPRLSWVVESVERGERQTAWQVLVASTPEALAADQGDRWDSGKMSGDETSHIVYNGAPLSSRSACYWKVRAWNKDGQVSAWSASASWTVGLLQASDWTAKWIDGLTFAPSGTPTAPPTILLARYEGITAGSGFLDVSDRISAMLAEGGYALTVNNGTFGSDPAFNTVKQLRIQYERDGQTFTKTFAEKAVVMIPADLPGQTNTVVTGARYESVANPGAFRDVTAVLTSKPPGSYSLVVNNTSFGPDPAPNQVKRLKVSYTVDGIAGVVTKAENATFNFPADLPKPVPATLTSARYEAIDGSGFNNVLATLNNMGVDGSYSVNVGNAAFGPDPAFNKIKRLRLEFQRDGRSWVKYVSENKVFNFPADLATATNVPLLRKSFTLAKPVRKATMYATALGLYELHLNGSRVGDHILAPEWTDYTKRLNYQSYDVTPLLAAGANVIGAQLANGWFSGHIGNGAFQYWGTSAALLAQLEIVYQDGTSERVVSDGSWKMAPSPTVYTDFMLGEDYDARMEVPGWSLPGFDDSAWSPTLLRSEPVRPMSSQTMEPVRKLMEITPKTLTQPAAGRWTYDMGQNMVGVLRLKITAPAGTRITLRHGERLNTGGAGSDGPAGTVYTANLRGAPSIDTYICKGGGEEIWTPKFTFHGFQYVELTGVAAQPALDAVTGIVFSSDTPQTGEFECSDGSINQLQSNIEWGQRGNYLSVPTDCPQRDERLGWLGDAQVFVRTATYNADIAAFFTKWMTDVTDSQLANGAYPDVAPNTAVGAGSPAWSDAGVICPWTIYQAYGDKRILGDNYVAMKKWVEYCRTNSTGSIRDRGRGSDFGDWLSINADTSKELIGTAYYAYSARLLGKSAAVLGNGADAATYEALFQTIKTAFAGKYIHPVTGAFIGTGANTQCAYAMALKFDLVPAGLRDEVVQLLENDVVAKGNHLSTGFVGVSYLLPVLTAEGKNDTAYDLLMQDTFPSWLFSVKNGATTIWERWDGWTEGAGFQTTIMNSFNHYSLGSCGEWLYGTVAGIDQDPTSAGFKKIVIRPQPGGELTSARGSLVSMNGLISSSWRKYAGGFSLETVIPANTTAVVHVPAAGAADVKESGVPASEVSGLTFLGMENGAAKFAVGSGRYRFTTGEATEPGTDEVSHDIGAPLKMRITTLMSNDGEGPYEFLEAGPLSVNGAAIAVIDGWIHFTPRPGANGADSFTYTIRDASGGIITRTVQVGIIPADAPVQKAVSITTAADESREVLFKGVSGRIYRIQSSETLGPESTWSTRATVQAEEDGGFKFTDHLPLPSARFYRAVFP
ncbi:MAG: family 78 glycoside hydrolase catalytic domain [Verrucomicrobiota bacterium]